MFLLRHLEELLYTRTHILIVIYICARAIDAIVYSYMVHVCVWLWHLDKTLNTLMHTHINVYTCARAIDVIVCGYMGHFRCGTRHSRQTQRQKVLHAASNDPTRNTNPVCWAKLEEGRGGGFIQAHMT